MRELVYLSDAKLKQFLPALRSLWPRPKFSVKAPFGAVEVDLTPSEQKARLQQLDQVVDHIGRTARWFTDPALEPGQWAFFESPLSYLKVGHYFLPDLVLFAAPNRALSCDPSGARVHLLLHGSSRHLLGGTSSQLYTPANSAALDFLAHISNLLDVLDVNSFSLPPAEDGQIPSRRRRRAAKRVQDEAAQREDRSFADVSYNRTAARDLLQAIEVKMGTDTAAWMSGYARISANLAEQVPAGRNPVRYLVASPLYVERTTPPVAP